MKTPAQVAGVEAGLSQTDPTARVTAHRKELTRMERVQANFVLIKRVWSGLIALGLGLALFGAPRSALIGVGLGILIQAAVMLAFDVFAEARPDVLQLSAVHRRQTVAFQRSLSVVERTAGALHCRHEVYGN